MFYRSTKCVSSYSFTALEEQRLSVLSLNTSLRSVMRAGTPRCYSSPLPSVLLLPNTRKAKTWGDLSQARCDRTDSDQPLQPGETSHTSTHVIVDYKKIQLTIDTLLKICNCKGKTERIILLKPTKCTLFKLMCQFYFFYVFYVFRTSCVHHKNCVWYLRYMIKTPVINIINTLRTGSFKLFKRPFPGYLTILTL